MGLLILRKRVQKKADYLRLRLFLENFLARRTVRELLRRGEDGRLYVEHVLDRYAA
ncbi:MAG: hypothetical protein H5T97_06780, partial [Firmicutes bacterium]|nr:hypothetical protein [Bacillota bacterium]